MTPGARVAAAIEVLDAWASDDQGLDRVLAGWGRGHRFAGSKDRRAIADFVYDAVRRMRSAAWLANRADTTDARALLIGSLRLDGRDPDRLFTGEGHAPDPLAPAERAPGPPLHEAPAAVRLDLPDWLMPSLGHVPCAALDRLRRRADVFLRVATLRASPETAMARLAEDGIRAEPGPLARTCLRVTAGASRIAASAAFRSGLVEIQDAASQAVAAFCAVRPGETVLDLCAGGGGKTLALADEMAGRGRLVAHDAAPARLAQIAPRAERAGVTVDIREPGAALPVACDLVLVDAPCSGSGAWARNPDAKWRLTPEELERLTQTQDGLLDRAAELVAPGGRIVYATCSLLEAENAARIAAFASRLPGFELGAERRWTPLDGGDGFYAARLERRS